MKCCASQTTFTVPERTNVQPASAQGAAAGAGDARAVAAQFEALLVSFALAPVAKSLGFYGDVVTGAVARAVAAGTHDGFAASLADDSK